MSTSTTISQDTLTNEAKNRRWFLATLGIAAIVIAANILVAWDLDVYGIFRDTHGRALTTSKHERTAKFLLNQAYVPENFDALIIGASNQVNWHPEYLTGYRFYDEALEGGNASEERRLIEQALPHGHFKVALIGVAPWITRSHLLQDGFDKASRAEAFGSVSSIETEYELVTNHFTHRPAMYFPNGSHSFADQVARIPMAGGEATTFQIDPTAEADYKALIHELLASGTRIIYIVNPMYEPSYEIERNALDQYMRSIKQVIPDAPVIDFLAPEYLGFRSNPANFIDNVHLSATGSETLSHLVNTKLQQLLQK